MDRLYYHWAPEQQRVDTLACVVRMGDGKLSGIGGIRGCTPKSPGLDWASKLRGKRTPTEKKNDVGGHRGETSTQDPGDIVVQPLLCFLSQPRLPYTVANNRAFSVQNESKKTTIPNKAQ